MARPTEFEQFILDKTGDALAHKSHNAFLLAEIQQELRACLERLDTSVDKWIIRRLEFVRGNVAELQRIETAEHGTLVQIEQAVSQHLSAKDAPQQRQ